MFGLEHGQNLIQILVDVPTLIERDVLAVGRDPYYLDPIHLNGTIPHFLVDIVLEKTQNRFGPVSTNRSTTPMVH